MPSCFLLSVCKFVIYEILETSSINLHLSYLAFICTKAKFNNIVNRPKSLFFMSQLALHLVEMVHLFCCLDRMLIF